MPMTKLTLTADPDTVRELKQIARQQGTSISAIFSRLAKGLIAMNRGDAPQMPAKIGPKTRVCLGAAKLPKGMTAEQVIEEAMFEKYGIKR